MDIILASGSPRRKELLEKAGYSFRVIAADADESIPQGTVPQDAVTLLAHRKASAVAERYSGNIVIGADTIVVLDGKILGKPSSEENAAELLRSLSGRTHRVYTGVALIKGGKEITFYEQTDVEFYPVSEEEIADYIKTGEPMDKAGAYGIQEKGALFVKKIDGDYFNVVGLPIAKLYRELKKIESL